MEITKEKGYRTGLMIQNTEKEWEFHEVPLSSTFTASLIAVAQSLRKNDQEALAVNISSLEEDSLSYPWLIFAVEQHNTINVSTVINDEPMSAEIEIIFRRDVFHGGVHTVHYPYCLESTDLSVFAK